MLKNYFKIAFRNLFKHKLYSLINIFGLAVGIACCVLIMLYVNNEWSYDEFHSKSDRIYRAWVHEDYGEGDIYFNTVTPFVLKPTLEQNIPEVESIARRYQFSDLVKPNDQAEAFSESLQLVDPSFLTIFDFELLKGDPQTALSQPNGVVITPEAAKRYFGEANPMQQSLLIKMGNEFEAFTVTGIIEKAPENSSIRYQLLIPFEKGRDLFSERAFTSWFNVSPETYVLLKDDASLQAVEAKFPEMMQQALGPEEYERSSYTVGLQPLTDIHLNTDMPTGIAPVSDPTYSYILGAIALLVLLIACVNFMTLSVSRSTSRAKEVGIRKTVGAQRQHLMYQFWGEALLMTVLALGFGVLLAELLLPYFNSLSGTSLSLDIDWGSVMLFAGLVAFISLVAGIYPALILSGFRPVEVLKGKLQIKGDKSLFRKGMVVFQFTLSIFLIASTIIVNRQLNFMRSKDLGYQKEQIVVLQTDATPSQGNGLISVIEGVEQKRNLLDNVLAGQASVRGVASSLFTPVQNGWIGVDFRDIDGKKRQFNANFVDARYLDVMGIDIIQGRGFSEENTSDARRAVVVNQALVDDYGWENPIGKRLPGENFIDHEIIGVTDNFNYMSLKTKVEPLAMTINPRIIFSGIDNVSIASAPSPRITVKLAPGDIPSAMDALEAAWEDIAPAEPFNFTFLDQAVDNQYRQEERLSQIVIFGSALAIIIACLGLFGLASLMVVRRTKEIGVRKVLGASPAGIMMLVNREFTKLVLVGFVLAAPLAWYAMNSWLQDFAYKADITVWVFLLAGVITLAVAWLTVSYQSVKATLINPVDSLRSE